MIRLISAARLLGVDAPVDVWVSDAGRVDAVTPVGALTASTAPGETLHADGRVLTSGLWDEHVHLGQWAQQTARPDFIAAGSAEQALSLASQFLAESAREAAHGAAAPELIGMRLRGGDWGGLTRAQLDGVSAEIPIVLIGVDLHGAWLNSAALRRHGFPADHGAHVVEDACFALLGELDRVSDAELDARVAAGALQAASRGIVGVVDFEMRWGVDDWLRREAAGWHALRVESAVYPQLLDRAISLGLRTGSPLGHGGHGGLASLGPLKVITDGSLGTRTALCCAPYPGGGHGRELVAQSHLTELLAHARRGGFTAAVHAIGDRANAQALDAFEASGAAGRIEHAQLLRPEDVVRFGRLGIAASVQPAHLLDDVPGMRALWPDRAGNAFPFASLLAAGAAVVFGSDAPVAPLDPWLAIAAAVTRAPEGDEPWVPEERLSVAQALRCSMRGPLRPGPGDAADLVLLDCDPLGADPSDEDPHGADSSGKDPRATSATPPPGAFRAPAVEATLLRGEPTYLAPSLR